MLNDENNNNNNDFNHFRAVTLPAVLVYKGPSMYKQTNLLTN